MRTGVMRSAMLAAGFLATIGFAAAVQATDVDGFVNTNVPGGFTWIDPSAGSINGTIHYTGNEGGEGAAVGRILLTGKDAGNNTVSIPVYCVDVADLLGPGVFTAQPLSSLSYSDAQRADLVKFVTYGDNLVSTTADAGTRRLYSAATQLGVWEILNETASNWDLLSGVFSVSYYDSSAIFTAAAFANSWLTDLKNGVMTANATETLGVLDPGAGNQTQVYITARGNNDIGEPGVPEPTTWGMIVVGFGMLGATLRRRKAAELFA